MSTAYLIYPYTVQDILDVGKTMVRTIDKTVHIPIEAYNEYTVRKAADEAAKQALIAQQRAELAAQEQIRSHLSASGAEGNPKQSILSRRSLLLS